MFDPAAFDATMGANTFLLADYHTSEFSPNLTAVGTPTPEPSSLLLVGTGLLVLVGLALKKTTFRPQVEGSPLCLTRDAARI